MALSEGVKYGLSSSSSPTKSKANKTLLFVKLTDSAIKAIEEFLKNQNKTGPNATLQFLGNEGRINIPTQHSQGQTFDFSLQSNADIYGPSGSFECIQQSSSRLLESMGDLNFKMRIKANEDVYAETRERIKREEVNRRQECAKEIRPDGNIGRKAKKDRILTSVHRRDPSPFSSSKLSPIRNGRLSNISSGSLNRGANGLVSNNAGPGNCKPGTGPADIAKRPIKERLIHLLAIKPFKKPELQARLARDGIKDRDKQLVMNIVKQIATFKNNEYVLLRGVWNDVQEDWPCYTEQERQLLKRRKPQNLTPPGSDSSVSSGVSGLSGLSPRSTASTSSGGNTSPSRHHQTSGNNRNTTASQGSNGGRIKRPSSTEAMDDVTLEDYGHYGEIPTSKRARVSHFKRPNSASGNYLSVNGRTDFGGSSPHFLQNRLSGTARLSPINGSGSQTHLTVPSAGHSFGSPLNNREHSSPSYFGGHGSPHDIFQNGDDVNVDACSPFSWNSKVQDHNLGPSVDSDETDSIDSGNGSSTSTSGRHYRDDNAIGGSSLYHGSILNVKSVSHRDPSSGDGLQISGAHSLNDFSSSRLSSNTFASSNVYGLSPQSSPESHQSKEMCDMDTTRLSSHPGYMTASGTAYSESFHNDCLLGTVKRSDHKSRVDKEARSSRGKEKANVSRDRNDRRDHQGHRSSCVGDNNPNLVTEKEHDSTNYGDLNYDCPSYLTRYKPIESEEQRLRYKEEFNNEYRIYRDLHAVIEKVSKKFAQLEERLRGKVRGSEEYQNIRNEIVKEYSASKKDRKYQEAKEKFNYLHKKLSHIKELVADYDRSLGTNCSSPVR